VTGARRSCFTSRGRDGRIRWKRSFQRRCWRVFVSLGLSRTHLLSGLLVRKSCPVRARWTRRAFRARIRLPRKLELRPGGYLFNLNTRTGDPSIEKYGARFLSPDEVRSKCRCTLQLSTRHPEKCTGIHISWRAARRFFGAESPRGGDQSSGGSGSSYLQKSPNCLEKVQPSMWGLAEVSLRNRSFKRPRIRVGPRSVSRGDSKHFL